VKRRAINIQFPLGGLNRRPAFRQQEPFSTARCLNVRPFASIEGRERGGSRPGNVRAYTGRMGTGPVRMLNAMQLALGDGFTIWTDSFSGLSFSSVWSAASWIGTLPKILETLESPVVTTVETAGAVRAALSIDTALAYTVEMFIAPWELAHHGKFQIFARMAASSPNATLNGIVAELVMEDATGAYSGTLKSYVAGVVTTYNFASGTDGEPMAGWFKVHVSSDTVTVYWNNHTLATRTVSSHTGTRVGFGIDCTQVGGVCLVGTFRVQYFAPSGPGQNRTMLVGSANGDLYKEGFNGEILPVTSNLDLHDGVRLGAAQLGQKLYLADYGDLRVTGNDGTIDATGILLDAAGVADWTALGIDVDTDVVVISNVGGGAVAGTLRITSLASGALTLASTAGTTGTCSYRIERAPKVYDPSADTIAVLEATAGQVPTGCPLVCRFNGRLILAGGEIAPHAWYASRQHDPTDWDYAEDDDQAAVAGPASALGVPGAPIVALMPHSDDYLIIGCLSSLWLMRGDPAYNGTLDPISEVVGVVGPDAWCKGPDGELVFLALSGLCVVPKGGGSGAINLSESALPAELQNVPVGTQVCLMYDVRDRGVHIYLTPEDSNDRIHWWFDWRRKTFWPISLAADQEPFAVASVHSGATEDLSVVMGGRDGYLRRFNALAHNDDGEAFASYMDFGPLPLGDDLFAGVLRELIGVMAARSGPVTWSVTAGDTFEELYANAVHDTGTWRAGRSSVENPGGRGMGWLLRLAGQGERWAFENAPAVIETAGRLHQ